MDSEADEKLRAPTVSIAHDFLEQSTVQEEPPLQLAMNGVPRKPVQRGSFLDPAAYPWSAPEIHPYNQSSRRISKSNARDVSTFINKDFAPPVPDLPPRPPVFYPEGPRPIHSRLHSVDANAPSLSPGQEILNPRRWSEQPSIAYYQSSRMPNTRHLSTQTSQVSHDAIANRRFSGLPTLENMASDCQSDAHNRSPSTRKEQVSLTLIRRYNGSQWNVAKISSIPAPDNSGNSQPKESSEDGLSVQINTAGYSKYLNVNDPSNMSGSAQIFERQLTRSSKASTSPGRDDNGIDAILDRRPRMSIDFRRSSRQSISSNSPHTLAPLRSQQHQRALSKKYSFRSPWDGICEFTSGLVDRSLKCKHTTSTAGSKAVTVSELRFNLPSRTSPTGTVTPRRPRATKSPPYFSDANANQTRDLNSNLAIESEYAENEVFDISLGQEPAGGGLGGKQAKLGKLIVEEEGQKMLDLVVAANMALWWKAYEKSA